MSATGVESVLRCVFDSRVDELAKDRRETGLRAPDGRLAAEYADEDGVVVDDQHATGAVFRWFVG
ncbi:hypothetical protein [Haladaptatus halobius]|uniref:hypothetical protein n=1 Tax=Haladaptatus halobius TaxID=2884875 RepID=UPI001D0AA75E|nr:hypothetical protein [Haladaptatus halobius]